MIRDTCSAASLSLALLALAGCTALWSTPTSVPSSTPGGFVLTSNSITSGGSIPKQFTCSGQGRSPELEWNGIPAGTTSLVLIVDDPDAPGGTFTHWVQFDIPPIPNQIAEGAPPPGRSAKNGAGRNGYTPPCPPSGTHRYFFRLSALDVPSLGLPDGVSRSQVEQAMAGHILAQAQLMGRYSK